MSTLSELWKNWEGRVADGKFPLRQWLGGSDHGAVFLTDRAGAEPRKAAIKLIPADAREGDQVSRWADSAKLSHPHLIRLFEYGRCQIDDTRLLYVVTEFAEENLAEILPLRPLTPDEASAMLGPTAEALAYLHKSGFVHGRIKPSNIMAVGDQLKISADRLSKPGERGDARTPSVYDAPEAATAGLSPAADIWSLGATLVAVLTQNEPSLKNLARQPVVVPATISQAIGEIARRCLQIDPQQRCTASDILIRLQPQASRPPVAVSTRVVETRPSPKRSKRWLVAPLLVAALVLGVWVGSKLMSHQPSVPAAEVEPAKPPADVPPDQSPAPFAEKAPPAPTGTARGSVLHQVMPDVSRNAQNTVQGRLKVVVDVSVDASGNVSEAKFVSPGPSKYFANRALVAARGWKFNPPQVNGQAAPSEWVLRFQFRRTAIDVFPVEKHP
ncbi:MAG: TonB family protein [Candidatus Sulfotelmatobacter sp.]